MLDEKFGVFFCKGLGLVELLALLFEHIIHEGEGFLKFFGIFLEVFLIIFIDFEVGILGSFHDFAYKLVLFDGIGPVGIECIQLLDLLVLIFDDSLSLFEGNFELFDGLIFELDEVFEDFDFFGGLSK